MIKDYLKENNLIITPNSSKKKVINEINSLDKLVSYKIMDINEFLRNYFFDYEKEAIYYVMKRENVNVSIALEYLNSLYFAEDKNYNNPKLNKLVSLKNELISNNLLITNNNFKYYLDKVNIIIYNYILDPFYLNLLSNATVVDISYTKKELEVLKFNSIANEIGYICSDIKEKIDSGININNIKIVDSGSEYYNVLDRLFSIANIPISIPEKISLYDLPIGKKVINDLKNDKTFDEIIENIEEETLLSKVVSILNNYVSLDIEKEYLIELITYDLKNTYLPKKTVENAVSLINIDEVNSEDITYLVGFNKENYPKIDKDTSFLSDNMRKELGLFTSNIVNKNNNELLKSLLYNNNFIISYKEKDSFDRFNPCLLIKSEGMKEIDNPKPNYNFSNLYNKLTLVEEYDKFYKYGIISDELKLLKNNYDLKYDSYDNKFTGINNNFKELTLSYSSLDNYFRCSFRYYLSNVLNIKEDDQDEFYMNLGKIFHYVLSKYRDKDFSFDESWNKEASKYEFKNSELVLLEKLKDELRFDIEVIKDQENYNSLDDYYLENKFTLNIENSHNTNVIFKGFVDKIISSKKDNNTLVSIIDYKTGTLHTDLSNVIYGINMQLPTYLYLVKRSEKFPDSIILGFYLQKIINKDMKRTPNKTIEELKKDELRLVGYSNSDIDVLREFDSTCLDSSYIKGLKTVKDGDFSKNSKVLDNNEIDELDKLVEDNINKATEDILNNNFIINPKRIVNDDIGCENCAFRDICFRKEKDFKKLPKHNGLDFLGGDNNA